MFKFGNGISGHHKEAANTAGGKPGKVGFELASESIQHYAFTK